MSHSKTDAAYNAVPTLDGSNYSRWAQTMELYLLSKSMWQIVDGKITKPASDGEQKTAWIEKSDAAKGLILLKIREDFRAEHMASDAPKIWTDLKTKYGETSDSQIFSWFCEWYKFSIPGSQSPQKEFAHWDLLVSKMAAASVKIPEKILAMQLVATMPPAYANIVPLMVADINKKELTVEKVKSYMLTEWERKQKPGKKALANRISAVQRKGNAPLFHQQQKASQPTASSSKQRADQPQQQQQQKKEKRQCAGRSKKGKGKGKAKANAADTGSDSESDAPNADNLFASLSLADHIQPATTSSVADKMLPEDPTFKRIQKNLADMAIPIGKKTTSKGSSYQNNPFALPFEVQPPINSLEYDPARSQAHYDAVHTPDIRSHFAFPPLTSPPRIIPGVTDDLGTPYSKIPKPPIASGLGYTPNYTIGLPVLRGGNSKKSTDPRPPPKAKSTVTLISGRGAVSRTVAENSPVQQKETPPSVYPCVEKSRKVAESLEVVKTTETMKTLERANFDSDEQMAPTDEVAMVEMQEIEARDEALFTEEEDEDAVSICSVPGSRKRSRSLSQDSEKPNSKSDNLDSSIVADFGRTEKPRLGTHGPAAMPELTYEEFETMPFVDSPFLVEKLGMGYDETNVVPGKVWYKENVQTDEVIETVWKRSFWITGQLNDFWDDYKKGHHQGKIIRFCPDAYGEIVDNDDMQPEGGFIKPAEYVAVYRSTGLYLDYGKKPISEPQKGYYWLWLPESKMWNEVMKQTVGTFTYDELQYRQDCSEDSIMGSGD
ncbi:hypothetical protein H1R20_g9641, partial [Candolleomyces eurysporus]